MSQLHRQQTNGENNRNNNNNGYVVKEEEEIVDTCRYAHNGTPLAHQNAYHQEPYFPRQEHPQQQPPFLQHQQHHHFLQLQHQQPLPLEQSQPYFTSPSPTAQRFPQQAAHSPVNSNSTFPFDPAKFSSLLTSGGGYVQVPNRLSKDIILQEHRRVHHSKTEQVRRQSIKDGFEDLRALIPSHHSEKMTRALILRKASSYIRHLRQHKTLLLAEVDRLQKIIASGVNNNNNDLGHSNEYIARNVIAGSNHLHSNNRNNVTYVADIDTTASTSIGSGMFHFDETKPSMSQQQKQQQQQQQQLQQLQQLQLLNIQKQHQLPMYTSQQQPSQQQLQATYFPLTQQSNHSVTSATTATNPPLLSKPQNDIIHSRSQSSSSAANSENSEDDEDVQHEEDIDESTIEDEFYDAEELPPGWEQGVAKDGRIYFVKDTSIDIFEEILLLTIDRT